MNESGNLTRARDETESARALEAMVSPRLHLGVFIALLVLLLITGGGSRADIESLVVLRPLAFLALGYAVLVADRRRLSDVRFPLALLILLAILIALQLIPLPPALWSALPGRDIYRDVYAAAGLSLPWLPLTLAPARGLNSFLGLCVPFAALLLFAAVEPRQRRKLYIVVWAGALASALMGVAQLASSSNGPLYLYRITNNGLTVGFLANRNHQGLLVSIGILLSGYLAASTILRKKRASALVLTGAAGTILLFLLFLLILGSRAGLLLGAAMMVPTVFMVLRALQVVRRPGAASLWQDRRVRWGGIAAVIAVLTIFAGAYLFSRSLAFDRLVGKEMGEDLRAAVLPIMLQLIERFLPLGSGFGSFETLFMRYEPLALLSPSYMNHAHNDWLEFALEGGVPAMMIMAAFVVWYGSAQLRVLRSAPRQFDVEKFTAAMIILAFGVASAVDYPLRVPFLMAVFSIACGHLAARRPSI